MLFSYACLGRRDGFKGAPFCQIPIFHGGQKNHEFVKNGAFFVSCENYFFLKKWRPIGGCWVTLHKYYYSSMHRLVLCTRAGVRYLWAAFTPHVKCVLVGVSGAMSGSRSCGRPLEKLALTKRGLSFQGTRVCFGSGGRNRFGRVGLRELFRVF